MKRILINATQPEELRVAIVDGQRLHDLDIEHASREQTKSNIYKASITRIEPSLEACFVDYGADRHGFLPLKEISRDYFKKDPGAGKLNIKEVLSEGQELIVQVDKEERGTKGAALTTFISLAGRFIVLMPNNPRAGGVSRRIEGEERDEARKAMADVEVPDGNGVIMRTNGIGRNTEEIQWDLNYLLDIWAAISTATKDRKAPFLVYQESNIILRALRDYLRPDIGEIIIDSKPVYERALQHMQYVMPKSVPRLKLYEDETPLFTRFQVESQIESAHERTVRLPSGGSIVLDHTEALTSIDINSARATGGSNIEETALNTNLEAADEIARQLRLRDMGGLVVVDFIDMMSNKNQRAVEDRLRDAVEIDRARIQLGRISRFGLLEMSRQRLRPSLGEHTQISCPRCNGSGQIRNVESLALSVLRLIEEESMKDRTARVIAQLPVEVATFLLNEKRGNVSELEQRTKVKVTLVPNASLHTPNYDIRRIRGDQLAEGDNADISYNLAQDFANDDKADLSSSEPAKRQFAQPAVSEIRPTSPAPVVAEVVAPTESFMARMKRWFGFDGSDEAATENKKSKKSDEGSRGSSRGASKTRGRSGQQANSRGGRGNGRQQNRGGKDDNRSKDAKPKKEGGAKQRDSRPQQDEPQSKAASGAEPSPSADNGEGGGRKRRRRRGGRNRGGRGSGSDNRSQDQQDVQNSQPADNDAAGQDSGSSENKPARRQSEASRADQDTDRKPAEQTQAAAPAADNGAEQPRKPRTVKAETDNAKPQQSSAAAKPETDAATATPKAADSQPAAKAAQSAPQRQDNDSSPLKSDVGNAPKSADSSTAEPARKTADKPAAKPADSAKSSPAAAAPAADKPVAAAQEQAREKAPAADSDAAPSKPAEVISHGASEEFVPRLIKTSAGEPNKADD